MIRTQTGRLKTTALAMAVLMPLSLGLEACVTTGGNDATLTPAERQLRQTETTRLWQGAIGGAIAGAVLGGLIVAMAGGNNRQIAAGAGAGAVAGGVGGAVYANDVNQQARPYAEANAKYEAMIKQADANIAAYGRKASQAATIARHDEARISMLNQQLADGRISVADYRGKIANTRGNIRALETQIDNANADLVSLTNAEKEGANIGNRKNELESQKRALESQRDTLVKIYDRIDDRVQKSI